MIQPSLRITDQDTIFSPGKQSIVDDATHSKSTPTLTAALERCASVLSAQEQVFLTFVDTLAWVGNL